MALGAKHTNSHFGLFLQFASANVRLLVFRNMVLRHLPAALLAHRYSAEKQKRTETNLIFLEFTCLNGHVQLSKSDRSTQGIPKKG